MGPATQDRHHAQTGDERGCQHQQLQHQQYKSCSWRDGRSLEARRRWTGDGAAQGAQASEPQLRLELETLQKPRPNDPARFVSETQAEYMIATMRRFPGRQNALQKADQTIGRN
jgi:hypothetical protein